MRLRVKICCIADSAEADAAVAAGADALGLVGDMPSGPGIITDEAARAIAMGIPPPVASFLLTSRERAADIAEHARYCATSAVQVVRHVDPSVHESLRERLPHLRRVQVIHVEDASTLDLAELYAPFVHAFLLDSGRPGAAVAELGGTGRTHDWAISAAFVARSMRPCFLAGGLKPDNVGDAVRRVRSFGLDLCSGVRTEDRLDGGKLAAFMRAVRAAENGIGP